MGSSYKLLPSFSAEVADQEVFWASSDSTVATVDRNGCVTAHKIGTATISCQLTQGLDYDLCTVRVAFKDVPLSGKYYSAPVYWAYHRGITKGYTGGIYDKSFGAGLNCERKDLAIFIWRYAEQPSGAGDARDKFSDMAAYGSSTAANKAVAWAAKWGIVKGYSDGTFRPNAPVDRKDVLIMLYRLAGKPEVSGTLIFSDCQNLDKNSDTYKAILWGAENRITNGYSNGPYAGRFGIGVECLREQIITFLYRYDDYINE